MNKSQERVFTPSRKRLRNLPQYASMSDDEFEEWFTEKYEGEDEQLFIIDERELKERKEEKYNLLAEDYDLEDMKANDLMQLESLILSQIQLDDLEALSYELRKDVSKDTILLFEKVSRVISSLKMDISRISEDLQLSRKLRLQSKDVGVAENWKSLTQKANEFYKQKMLFIFCEECKTLLSTTWLLFPDSDNQIKLYCEKCEKFQTTKLNNLYETGNKNLEDVVIP